MVHRKIGPRLIAMFKSDFLYGSQWKKIGAKSMIVVSLYDSGSCEKLVTTWIHRRVCF